MAEAKYAPNHTIDPETGFLENKGYPFAFDAERKKLFIETLVDNGMSIYNTCKALKLSHHTFFNHLKSDPQFKASWEEAKELYKDRLAGVSMMNAMNPKSVIERIFQLKWLYPERYADQKGQGNLTVNISVSPDLLQSISKRQETIDIEAIPQGEIEHKI